MNTNFVIANKYLREKKYDKAIVYYNLAIADDDTNYMYYLNSAYASYKIGDYLRESILNSKAFSLYSKVSIRSLLKLDISKSLNILIYPGFTTNEEMSEFLSRVFWHYYPIVEYINNIYIISDNDISNFVVPEYFCKNIYDIKIFFERKMQFIDDCQLENMQKNIDFTLIWKYSTDEERKHPFKVCLNSLYKKPIWRVDENTERFASSFFLKSASSMIDVQWMRYNSYEKFKKLSKTFKKNKVYVFGTGPSLSQAFRHNFNDGDCIVSNSMVKNIELLDYLKPKLIVCADPIFHAGVSTYAEEFRKQLTFALDRYRCPLIVPERDFHIYVKYFENYNFDVIALPFESNDYPNVNILDNFYVSATGNILTLFLLQLAYTFADKIEIFGCDGRPLTENSYFWGHDKSAQFNDQMDAIQLAHPGFFNISYDDYYSEHCSTLQKWIEFAEQKGKTILSRTFTYIPALKKRENSPYL